MLLTILALCDHNLHSVSPKLYQSDFPSMSACVTPLCMMLVILLLLIIDLFSLLLFLFKTLGHAVLSLLYSHLQETDLLRSNHRSGHKAKRFTATALQSLKRTIDFFFIYQQINFINNKLHIPLVFILLLLCKGLLLCSIMSVMSLGAAWLFFNAFKPGFWGYNESQWDYQR